jgi:hypothetical protein
VTGQGCLNGCGLAKAGWVSSAAPMRGCAVSDIYTTDHNRLPSVDCDTFGLTANVSSIKVWVIPLHNTCNKVWLDLDVWILELDSI